jgi:hypothetical protein
MLDRIMGVITLKAPVYREIADDQSGTSQAAMIVIVVSIISGFCRGLVAVSRDGTASLSLLGGIVNAVVAVVVGLIGWAIAAWVLAAVAKAMGGKTDTGEMLRVTGYVHVFSLVTVLNLALLISPALGCITALVSIASGIAYIIGYLIGVREAAEFSTGNAVIAALVAAVIDILITVLVGGAIVAAIAAALAVSGAR